MRLPAVITLTYLNRSRYAKYRTSLQRVHARARDLGILIAIAAADANGANELAVHHERQPAWRAGDPGKRQKERMPALDGVEERLGWPSIARRCSGSSTSSSATPPARPA